MTNVEKFEKEFGDELDRENTIPEINTKKLFEVEEEDSILLDIDPNYLNKKIETKVENIPPPRKFIPLLIAGVFTTMFVSLLVFYLALQNQRQERSQLYYHVRNSNVEQLVLLNENKEQEVLRLKEQVRLALLKRLEAERDFYYAKRALITELENRTLKLREKSGRRTKRENRRRENWSIEP